VRVAVVGGGVFGQVIAWRLALLGAGGALGSRSAGGLQVTLVEPRGPANAGSGSGDRSRIVRALYDEPFFAEAGFHGLRLWGEWSRALGVRLVEDIGVAYLVRREGQGAAAFRAWVAKGVGHVRALGGEVVEMSPGEATRRWPAMQTGDLESVAFEPGGGYGRAALATKTIARAGAAAGVTHVAGRVTGIEERGGKVTGIRWDPNESNVGAAGGVIAADVVIVASGFAGAALVGPFCGGLPITRIAHWASYWDVPYPEGAALHESGLPAWADLGAELYGFPDDGECGFKAASHAPRPRGPDGPDAAIANALVSKGSDARVRRRALQGPTSGSPGSDVGLSRVRRRALQGPTSGSGSSDPGPPAVHAPGEASDAPSLAEIEALRERVALRFPAIARARCRSVYLCAYDSTADERFQIGPVPNVEGLWFVGAMSGHGFKHAPSLGTSVAEAVMGARPTLDLSPYALRVGAGLTARTG